MMKGKLRYLNVGCGNKYHNDWVNVDMVSNTPEVIAANLIKGIPFPSGNFEVVYHSQVLEHIPKEHALAFLQECRRVLMNDGIIRIVVPDLENIVDEYKKYLEINLSNPTVETEANYDWIMLELYDQTVRNFTGGLMAKYIQQEKMVNEQYVLNRTGYIGKAIRRQFLGELNSTKKNFRALGLSALVKKTTSYAKRKTNPLFLNERYKIGDFRIGGEVHMWMYDRYSLGRLLKEAGFKDVKVKTPFDSDIPHWSSYELDVKDNEVFDPTSLFMEARK